MFCWTNHKEVREFMPETQDKTKQRLDNTLLKTLSCYGKNFNPLSLFLNAKNIYHIFMQKSITENAKYNDDIISTKL